MRNRRAFYPKPKKSVTYGCKRLYNLAASIWELAPNYMKSLQSVACFKRAIKNGNQAIAYVV